MDPLVWGEKLWTYIHCVAAVSKTPQQRRDFVDFVEILARTLPCDKCKQHFRQNLRNINIQNYMKNEETLFMWTYLMHDAVNAAQNKLGKGRPSFGEVYGRYFNVKNDQDAIGSDEYENKICQEVCQSTCGETQQETSKQSNENTTSKILHKKVFKARK